MSPFSSFLSRLRTNHIVIEAENAIQERRTQQIQEALRGQLVRRQELWNLNQSRDTEEGQGLTSPIRYIPVDVLREVFVQCLPFTHNAIIYQHEIPLLLTRICSDWREIAITTPRLWQSIHIPIPSFTPLQPEARGRSQNYRPIINRFIHLIQTWLERSGVCPLNISISNEQRVDPGVDYYRDLIKEIISVSGRWKNVTICGSSPDVGYFIHALHGSKLPLLETLTLSLNTATSYALGRLDWTTLNGRFRSPSLREVSFLGIGGDYSKFPLDFSRLTHLTHEGTTMSATGVGIVLSWCRNLISCRIDIATKGQIGEDSPQYNQRIYLPSLARFSIREWDHDLSHLFTLLDAPSLRHIEYRRSNTLSTRCTILPLFDRSVILTFVTDGNLLAQVHLLELLQHIPQLQELFIRPSSSGKATSIMNVTKFDDKFLTALSTAPFGQRYCCPELEVFECHIGAGFSNRSLKEFIRRRQTEGSASVKLKRIAVTFHRPATDTVFEDLDKCIQDGLRADIKYPEPSFSLNFDPRAGLVQASVNPHPF